MIFTMLGLGLLSALAIGPASFNIIRSLLVKREWPWAAILGFLLGDVIYIALSLVLLQSPFLQDPAVKTILTFVTIILLGLYAAKVLLPKKEKSFDARESLDNDFVASLFLTLSNFHLLLIYAGLFINISHSGVLVYLLAFVGGFLGLLAVLSFFQSSLRTILRKIEVFVGFGFLFFSVYLSMGIL